MPIFRSDDKHQESLWAKIGSAYTQAKSAAENIRTSGYSARDALQLGPAQGGVSLIARIVASSELMIMKQQDDGSWIRTNEYLPAWADPDKRPNYFQTQTEMLFNYATNLVAAGNGYILIYDRDRDTGLPDLVSSIPDKDVSYHYEPQIKDIVTHSDKNVIYRVGSKGLKPYSSLRPKGRLLHNKLFTMDNIARGQSPFAISAPPLRTALASEGFSETFFQGGGNPPGVFLSKGDLGETTVKSMSDHYDEIRRNPNKLHRPLVLVGDWNWLNTFVNPEQMQLIDSRKLMFPTVAAVLGLPGPLIGAPDTTTWGSGMRELVRFSHNTSLGPLLYMIGRNFSELLPPKYACKLNPDVLLGAEPLDDARVDAREVEGGWLLPSEVRKRRGYAPIEDIDDRFEKLNLKPRLRDGGDSDSGKEVGNTDEKRDRVP